MLQKLSLPGKVVHNIERHIFNVTVNVVTFYKLFWKPVTSQPKEASHVNNTVIHKVLKDKIVYKREVKIKETNSDTFLVT